VVAAIVMGSPIRAGSEYPLRSGTATSAICIEKQPVNAHGRGRYYARITNTEWPPEIYDYNRRFTKTLEAIKRRHDPTVTTVAQGVIEWKSNKKTLQIGLDVQAWLDRFYMSRIGIRFLIGQRGYIDAL
jgi:pyruvate dehydrogenase kinase 2/3/4